MKQTVTNGLFSPPAPPKNPLSKAAGWELPKWQKQWIVLEVRAVLSLGMVEGQQLGRHTRGLPILEMLCILTCVGMCIKIHPTVHLGLVHFTVCMLHLNKNSD